MDVLRSSDWEPMLIPHYPKLGLMTLLVSSCLELGGKYHLYTWVVFTFSERLPGEHLASQAYKVSTASKGAGRNAAL